MFYFAFDSKGNIESFSKQKVIVQKYVVLQRVNHDKYNHMPSISQSEAFLKTTLEF